MLKRVIQTLVLSALFTVVVFINACGGKSVVVGDESKVTKGPISVWATWVKDKGKKFDLQLNVSNEGKHDVIIMLGDMSCYRGSTQGMLKHTFFNTGERVIDIHAGQIKSFNMVCDYRQKSDGAFKILISKVYDNPGNDGTTRGKAIVSDLEWKVNAVN